MSHRGRSQVWDDDRNARLALSRLCEPGDPAMARAVRRDGAPEVLATLRGGRHEEYDGAQHWLPRLSRLDVDADRRAGEAAGARFLVPGDDEWPTTALDPLDARAAELPREAPAPLGLWVRGAAHLQEFVQSAAAVVGCRAPTLYGIGVATLLGQELAARGTTVVSGAAYGIDRSAHEGALTAEGPTLAVLAGGVDVPYPRGNAALIARIGRVGLVVAEAPPRSAPTRVRFLRRNRIIAALGLCTVVVEAAHRSGALSTAAVARQLLRPVGAVPGAVTSSVSAGCHRLLREPEVTLVRDAADVLELLLPLTAEHSDAHGAADAATDGTGRATSPASEQQRLFDLLDETELRVVEAVPLRRAVDVTGILRVAGLDLVTVQAALTRLERRGLVMRDNGCWSRARAVSETSGG